MQHFANPIFWTVCAVTISLCSFIYVVRHNAKKEEQSDMSKKVDTSFCLQERKSVRQSIELLDGRVTENEDSLKRGNKRFTKTEKCLIALVEHHIGKGEAAKMGLYE